ncbi:hypothetical protein PG987_005297 [Apiospora arundinis]
MAPKKCNTDIKVKDLTSAPFPNDHFGHVHAQMPKATLSPPKAYSTDPEHSAQMGRFQFCMTPRGRVLAEDDEGMRDEDGGDAAASAQE